jgi:PemK-like, MazF-like toxin of type II toxin-antitoxin system
MAQSIVKRGSVVLIRSSTMPEDLLPTDLALEREHPSFLKTGLKRRSVLRMHKLALLHKALVLRVLGEIDQTLMGEINHRLRLALGL